MAGKGEPARRPRDVLLLITRGWCTECVLITWGLQVSSSDFRAACCYTQDACEVLEEWAGTLRAIFDAYAWGDGAIGDELHSRELLDIEE